MLLVLTHSEDVTTDLVLDRLKDLEVFRFNIDLWRSYEWRIGPQSFLLRDPTGRECVEERVSAVYLRKLFFNPPRVDVPSGGSLENWRRGEIEEVWTGIRDLAWQAGKLALVHPSPAGRWNKMRQMRVAAAYFRVPEWSVFRGGGAPLEAPVVAKNFTQNPLGNGGLMTVQPVDPSHLSADFPWFLQRQVAEATHDVTIAWVDGGIFAYELSRDGFDGTDCRIPSVSHNRPWLPFKLSTDEHRAVSAFMGATGYSFGRLDFLRDNRGLLFLELNPNGQFAWLDPHGDNGLLDAVAEAVRKVHISNRPGIPAGAGGA